MPSVFYLDTSALNFLADHVKDFEMLASAKKHLGFDLYLSPIGLWEVLLNTNDDRRDYIIYWAQFNCSKNLLKSPTEIIIQYIKQGCPLKDRKVFFKDIGGRLFDYNFTLLKVDLRSLGGREPWGT